MFKYTFSHSSPSAASYMMPKFGAMERGNTQKKEKLVSQGNVCVKMISLPQHKQLCFPFLFCSYLCTGTLTKNITHFGSEIFKKVSVTAV